MTTLEEVGKAILMEGIGYTIDSYLDIDDIEDSILRDLCRKAKIALDDIQFYLEDMLGENFFDE